MSAARPGIARGFRNVDAQTRREEFGAYLERFAIAMAAQKSASHTLLEPERGQRLLDVGCGRGDDVRALAPCVGPNGRVVGIDISETLIGEARQRGTEPCVRFHLADAHAMPFADASFDAARVERVLQHVQDPARALAEMARVVRPGGIIVASEPDWGTLAVDAVDRDTTRELARLMCDCHIRNGWIGRQLPGHFARLGIVAIEVLPVTLAIRSFTMAADLLQLRDNAEPDWLQELQDRDSDGTFFAAITGFTVKGRVDALEHVDQTVREIAAV
jgi:ubiquinone/menaquinone biosynthesis C-methylase UbiE